MLFRNTLAQSASFGLGYIYSILLAPFMISRLGLDLFGVWAVTGALATYAGLLDLGVGKTLARFVAIFDVEGDDLGIRQSVGLGCLIVTGVGLVAGAVAAALAPLRSDQIGLLDTGEMRLVVLASVAIWTCYGYVGIFSAVCEGKRRMVPSNVAFSIAITFNFLFSLAALALSDSLLVYAYANLAAALLGIPTAFLAMRHVWKGPRFALPSRALAKEVIGFSAKNQVSWFADLINLQTDKLIIALMIDIRSAAVYEIGSRVVGAVRGAAVMATSAIIPTAAARIAEEGREAIGAMYRHVLTRVCATAFPLFVVAAVSSPFLLVAWLGSVPAEAGIVIPILSAAYLITSTTGAGTTIAIGAGAPGFAAANAGLIAILNIVFTVALTPFLDLWGVVIGTAAAIVIGSAIFNSRFLEKFELRRSDFWEGVMPAGILAVGFGIPPALLAIAVGMPADRLAAFPLLAVSVLSFGLPYWALASRRGLLPAKLELPLSMFRSSRAAT
jgi:O-antigen/teichoic acid export membrane protein